MRNDYEKAEPIDVGRAQDIIRGPKPHWYPWDSDVDAHYLFMWDDDE